LVTRDVIAAFDWSLNVVWYPKVVMETIEIRFPPLYAK
jgi:hypothetical protein